MKVDWNTYYSIGRLCFQLADAVQDAFIGETEALAACKSMAGVDEAGVEWGKKYDARVVELLRMTAELGEGLQNLGGVITQAGYNYQLADYYSTRNPSGAIPEIPSTPGPECRYYGDVPSAGGPSEGIRDTVDTAITLADKMLIPIPDGDTGKLQTASDIWHRLETGHTADIAWVMNGAAERMDVIDAPDADAIRDRLRAMQGAVDDVLGTCGELATMCSDQKSELETLRRETLTLLLNELAAALLTQVVITAATAWLTCGLSAVATSVASGTIIGRFAGLIADAVGAWHRAKSVREGQRAARDLQKSRNSIDEARNLSRNRPVRSESAPKAPAGTSAADKGNKIGDEIKDLPKGSGKPDIMATKLTEQNLSHDEAVEATIAASQRAFGEIGGTAPAVGGGTVILPYYATQNVVMIVRADGSVIAARGSVIDFIAR
ncbi:hypothetical protein ACFVAV_16460 [Nocardia sp. NPDC057663]|uniref:hypothetical protein n=1 Tax=Nocardia sp. NPDC057663 TaxID=3346201 RepID=UPI00366C75E8